MRQLMKHALTGLQKGSSLFLMVTLMTFVLALSSKASAVYKSDLRADVIKAIEHFFYSSQRQIEDIQIGTFSRLTGDEYLMEASVIAQAPFSSEFIPYHCGIFILRKAETGKINWVITALSCEPNSIHAKGRF